VVLGWQPQRPEWPMVNLLEVLPVLLPALAIVLIPLIADVAP
jgi:hypothetical protein